MAKVEGKELAAFAFQGGVISAIPKDFEPWDAAVLQGLRSIAASTCWDPFIAGDDQTDEIFDFPRGSDLWFRSGILDPDDAVIKLEGDTLVSNSDFWLRSRGGGEPSSYIRLDRHGWCPPNSVVVTALWGRFTWATLPLDAKYMILRAGLVEIYGDLQGYQGEITYQKQGPVEFKFGTTGDSSSKISRISKTLKGNVDVYARRLL